MAIEVGQPCFVMSSGGDYYGPFNSVTDAARWAEDNEEIVGDYVVEILYAP